MGFIGRRHQYKQLVAKPWPPFGGNTYTVSGSGGLIAGGAATVAEVNNQPASGSLALGGVATVSAAFNPSSIGGVVLGGATTIGNVSTLVMAGALTVFGLAPNTFLTAANKISPRKITIVNVSAFGGTSIVKRSR